MDHLEQELNDIRSDLDNQQKQIDMIGDKTNEIHDAIVGNRLFPSTGLAYQIKIVQDNIHFLTKQYTMLEKAMEDRFNKIDLQRADSNMKVNIMWTLIGACGMTVILFLLNYILTKK